MPRISQARDLETLQQHFVAKRERVKTTIVICGGTGCQASRLRLGHRCRPGGTGKAGPHAGCGGARDGMPRVLRTGADHGLRAGQHLLLPRDAEGRPGDRVPDGEEGRGHRTVPLHGPRLRQKGHEGSRNPLLQRPGPAAAQLQQARRRLLHRGLHRHRRLQGNRQGAHRSSNPRPSSPRSRPRAFAAAAAQGSPRAASGRRPTRRPATRST